MPSAGKSNKELACELSTQGMSIKEISKELEISYNTVYGWIRKSKGKVTDQNALNADRHLCKTCQYRTGTYDRNNMGAGCDYLELVGHSRGCPVENCNVYVKGSRPKTERKGIRARKEKQIE